MKKIIMVLIVVGASAFMSGCGGSCCGNSCNGGCCGGDTCTGNWY